MLTYQAPENEREEGRKLQALRGTTAIVTGAGREIGREIALLLVSNGVKVIVVDKEGESAASTAHDAGRFGEGAKKCGRGFAYSGRHYRVGSVWPVASTTVAFGFLFYSERSLRMPDGCVARVTMRE